MAINAVTKPITNIGHELYSDVKEILDTDAPVVKKLMDKFPFDEDGLKMRRAWTTKKEELAKDPDTYYTFAQIAAEYGFVYSAEQVETEDGYLLTVMHISNPDLEEGAPAVLLQHGLFTSGEWFIMHK